MFLHVKQSDCKAAVKVVSGIWLKVCVPSFPFEIIELIYAPKTLENFAKTLKRCMLQETALNKTTTTTTKIGFIANCSTKLRSVICLFHLEIFNLIEVHIQHEHWNSPLAMS